MVPPVTASVHRRDPVPDIIADDLDVLFVGINPGFASARAGHHFANPANGFWRLMHEGGFTQRRFLPSEGRELLAQGIGITNIVARETAGVKDLTREDFDEGRRILERKIARFRPKAVVFVGVTVYRAFRGDTSAITCGEQPERIAGARVFVVPNPSGRNAHYRYEDMLAFFRDAASQLYAHRG
ncbi:mismatch-specific DNA-glycosylase [Pendulispora brunnea]|uniref:Mismatch-specific DNA-glycosylase n=1 Tax=Pendulispora brunnea TaxID=2905690 RepID=A0ABZ2KCF6_9BACT